MSANKLTVSVVVAALAFAGPLTAALQIDFDMDGTGSYAGFRQLTPNGLFDLQEGNAVIAGAMPVLADPINTIGANLQSYYQAQVTLVYFDNGDVDSPFANPPSEITMQAALPMLYTGVNGFGELVLDVGVGTNFLRMYYDPTLDSSITTGLGFGGGGDSILILEAEFTNLDFSVPPSLVTAEFLAIADVIYTDPDFFVVPGPLQLVIALDLDGLVHIPPQLPPSASIVGYTPTLADLRMSMDLSARFGNLEAIPELSSGLLLVGAGFGLALANRLRRSKAR